jgi:hypothetical protein
MACTSTITNAEILALLFAIAPQFATTDAEKLASYNAILDAIRCQVNERALGCCGTLALANLLAHYLTLSLNPIMGMQTNIAEGQLSIGFASTINSGFFSGSPYGQAYLNLIGNYKVGALTTGLQRNGWYGPSCCGGGGYGFGF